MIQTIYSNSFEVLQTAFLTYVKYDLEKKYGAANIFVPVNVVTPSEAISDQLKRSLADNLSICAGVNFLIVQKWLSDYTTKTLYQTVSSLDWLVWKVLKEKKLNPSKDKRDEPLNKYLKSLDEIGLIEFARHLSSLFVTYGTYRFDWLMAWSGQKLDPKLQNAATLKERMELRKDPNFGWQSELWKEIVEADQVEKDGIHRTSIVEWLNQMADNLQDIDLYKQGDKPIHLFMPFALPPVLLPLIKKFSSKGTPLLYMYILNPCSEYWFEALPKKLFDWKLDNHSTSFAAQTYLSTNAASTRAMIDRLFSFLSDTNGVFESQEDDQYTKYQDSERKTQKRIFGSDPSQYKPDTDEETVEVSSAYIFKGSGSFLSRFQDSILKLDNSLLPTEPDPMDESLRVLQAPSFTRELEAFVDILHHWMSNDPKRQIKASDILVVVPDIQKAAPYIDGVMRELPDNMSLPWKILGLPLAEQNRMAQACVGMLELLQSNFTIDEFFSWLELPTVQSVFSLSLNDLTVLRNWLNLAGFRFGINSDQLKAEGFDDEDCSLDMAIERLTLGFFMKNENPEIFDQTLTMNGSEDRGFDYVTDESGRLLMTITKIFELFNNIKQELNENHYCFSADIWCTKLSEWFQNISNEDQSPEDATAFYKAFKGFVDSIQEAFGNRNDPIELAVIANEFSKELSSSVEPVRLSDAITFAPIQLTRGLPFRIIGALGFDEDSNFPGKSKFEEFDLMKDFPRRGDRDARKDNNAIFLDTLLSAKENLIISYSVGTKPQADNNPSVVIENFKNYFLSHAREEDRSGNKVEAETNNSRAEELWDSLISRVPLNKFSQRNFDKSNLAKYRQNMTNVPRFNPFWVSPRKDVKDSVELAIEKGHSDKPEQFVNIGIPKESLPPLVSKSQTLPLNQLVEFVTKPGTWALKAHKLYLFERREKKSSLLPPDTGLDQATTYQRIHDLLKAGLSEAEILEIEKLNPLNGMKNLRENSIKSYIVKSVECVSLMNEIIKERFNPTTETLSFVKETTLDDFHQIKFISDVCDKLYRTRDDGKPYWINICTSKSERIKLLLRQFFWIALEQSVSQILINSYDGNRKNFHQVEEVTADCIKTDVAQSLLKNCLKLLKLQIDLSTGLTDKRYINRKNQSSNERNKTPLLLRGNPDSEKILKNSDKFQEILASVLNREKVGRSKPSIEEVVDDILNTFGKS